MCGQGGVSFEEFKECYKYYQTNAHEWTWRWNNNIIMYGTHFLSNEHIEYGVFEGRNVFGYLGEFSDLVAELGYRNSDFGGKLHPQQWNSPCTNCIKSKAGYDVE